MTDDDLGVLARYAREQDPEAFRALVQRHQSMVFAACRRILGNAADAEDAAQTCFLLLAKKASRVRHSVSGWLHKVAVEVSVDMLRKGNARRKGEMLAAEGPPTSATAGWNEIKGEVDQAVAVLPERLRAPVVLHYLEGRTQGHIAAELGITQSAVSKRLCRGLQALERQFNRRGIALSAGILAGLLAENAAEAAPATLAAALGKMALAGIGAAKATAVTTGVIGGATMIKAGMIAVAAAAVLVLGLAVKNQTRGESPAAASDEVPLARIIARIQARQRSVRSVEYKWTLHKVRVKGSLPRMPGGKQPGPVADVEYRNSLTLIIDGDKVRTEEVGTTWNTSTGEQVPLSWSWYLVDGQSMTYGASIEQGYIGSRKYVTLPQFQPLFIAYRLFDPVLGLADPEDIALTGRAEHEAHPCVVIESSSGMSHRFVNRWFLAEDQGYSPVRFQRIRDDDVLIKDVNLKYAPDDEVGWRLMSWSVNVPSEGAFTTSVDPVIEINKPVRPESFELEFPPGTTIYNGLVGVEYVAGEGPPVEDPEHLMSAEPMEVFVKKVEDELKQQRPTTVPPSPTTSPVPAPTLSPRSPIPFLLAVLACGAVVVVVTAITIVVRKRRAAE